MNQKEHIKRAIEIAGSQRALAKDMGCTQQAISKLLHSNSEISVERARDIDIATGGQVGKHELRPDFFDQPPDVSESIHEKVPA